MALFYFYIKNFNKKKKLYTLENQLKRQQENLYIFSFLLSSDKPRGIRLLLKLAARSARNLLTVAITYINWP